jgi:hypothetical protein
MIFENIQTLYSIYRNIEIDFNKLVEQVNNNSCTKIKVLNSVSKLNQETINWIEDNRFTTGKYKERNAES